VYCLCVFQKLHDSLSSDRRLAELQLRVKQLPSSEQSKVLTQSVEVVDEQRIDIMQQVTARQRALDECLSWWTQFDDNYHKLLDACSALHADADATKDLAAEDAIVKIENVSVYSYISIVIENNKLSCC